MINVDMTSFKTLVQNLADTIQRQVKLDAKCDVKNKYSNIFGIPQGGVPVAIELAHCLELPVTTDIDERTLIVDDLVDSGLTIKDYMSHDAAVLFVKNVIPSNVKYYAQQVQQNEWVHFFWEKKNDDIEQSILRIIQSLELDSKDANLVETPQRIARMYKNELFYHVNDKHEPKITVFPNTEKYNNIVLVKNIELVSTCSHHFVPFIGKVHIAYIPNEHIIGISKLARVADFYAKRPQLQENLTKQIADYLEKKLVPKGIAVVIEASHMCMVIRGVKKPSAVTVTSELRGAFYDDAKTRQEFFELIK